MTRQNGRFIILHLVSILKRSKLVFVKKKNNIFVKAVKIPIPKSVGTQENTWIFSCYRALGEIPLVLIILWIWSVLLRSTKVKLILPWRISKLSHCLVCFSRHFTEVFHQSTDVTASLYIPCKEHVHYMYTGVSGYEHGPNVNVSNSDTS